MNKSGMQNKSQQHIENRNGGRSMQGGREGGINSSIHHTTSSTCISGVPLQKELHG